MNRWSGKGELTKDPRFVASEGQAPACLLRIAVEAAGRNGADGYFDVKCFAAQALACAEFGRAGGVIEIDGHLLFDESVSQNGGYATRTLVVAEHVRFVGRDRPE